MKIPVPVLSTLMPDPTISGSATQSPPPFQRMRTAHEKVWTHAPYNTIHQAVSHLPMPNN